MTIERPTEPNSENAGQPGDQRMCTLCNGTGKMSDVRPAPIDMVELATSGIPFGKKGQRKLTCSRCNGTGMVTAK